MRIVDCHVHVGADADAGDMLRRMDANGIDRALLISPPERRCPEATREKLLATRALLDADPQRLSGLAWVNPAIEGMADLAAEALDGMGFAGLKIIPDRWYAHEARLEPFWERMNEQGASILFHTGILYLWEDASRFCRPVYLEKLLLYPSIRFAMAHIAWPWCEECLAVMGRMRAAAGGTQRWQSYVDLTPGTPPHIRRQAVAAAVDFCGPDRLMFGTDSGIPGRTDAQREKVERDLAILRELHLSPAEVERIMSGTADEVFGARA